MCVFGSKYVLIVRWVQDSVEWRDVRLATILTLLSRVTLTLSRDRTSSSSSLMSTSLSAWHRSPLEF